MTLRRGAVKTRSPEDIARRLPEIYRHPPGPGEVAGEQHFPLSYYLEDLAEECREITGNGDTSEVVQVAEVIGSAPAQWYKRSIRPSG